MKPPSNQIKILKTVFFSSSSFTLPILEELIASPTVELVGVVTQPDWENRGKLYKNPISKYCDDNKIRTFKSTKLSNESELFFAEFPDIDLGVVASYGQIIKKDILNHPKLGMINWHPSLLPLYRGPTPLQSSILNQDTAGGLTWIKMDTGMDSGDILNQYPIDYNDLTFSELIIKLGVLGARTLDEVLKLLIERKTIPQDSSKATFTKMLTKDSGLIENSSKLSLGKIYSTFKALDAFPKLTLNTKTYGLIKILSANPIFSNEISIDSEDEEFYYSKGKIYLKCLDGLIQINEFQLQNGRKMKSKN